MTAYEEYDQHRDFFAAFPLVQLFLILAEICIVYLKKMQNPFFSIFL